MRRRLPFLIIFLTLFFYHSTTVANPDNKFEDEASPVSFSTSGAGWFRVGGWTGASANRGATRIVVSLLGGSYDPQSVVIDAIKNWSAGVRLSAKGINNIYVQQVRIVQDTNYYVENICRQSVVGKPLSV
ncbi:hypothetical protein [uncultured Roseivirga sp.]|mgnify:CR=1 FL=1|uniref:hypothetical protein n=1 Tax=uncultured Roseivirga sp. TaxID=543088 RepID=UPI0030D86031|tara:strand:- start:3521 stop:3910 length:390 start_codon:yes stop_codon:yes gene_type:complete